MATRCMYGQLKEVQVKVGDYLEAGNVIGYLEIPTKYYSLEGCNLYFEMLKMVSRSIRWTIWLKNKSRRKEEGLFGPSLKR